MDNTETLGTLGIQDIRRRLTNHKNTTQHRKLKRWATRTPTKDKQFLFLTRHPPYFSYSQDVFDTTIFIIFIHELVTFQFLYFQLHYYRFSIAWSRVFSDGTMASRNPAGIQYYHNLIDELIKYNIEPMVTLYHWDLPQGLHEKGGWENDTIINYFNDYARAMFQEYGDKVRVTPYFFLAQITFVLQSNLHMFSSLVNSYLY